MTLEERQTIRYAAENEGDALLIEHARRNILDLLAEVERLDGTVTAANKNVRFGPAAPTSPQATNILDTADLQALRAMYGPGKSRHAAIEMLLDEIDRLEKQASLQRQIIARQVERLQVKLDGELVALQTAVGVEIDKVLAAEREACAKVAEQYEPSHADYQRSDAFEKSAWDLANQGIAAAIRARSQEQPT